MLELGCGTGELLKRFQKEYHCHGLDISEHMLKVAQEKLGAQKVPLFLGDMVDFDTGERYDIILSIFDTVNHIIDMIDLKRHFRSVFANLNPGGFISLIWWTEHLWMKCFPMAFCRCSG